LLRQALQVVDQIPHDLGPPNAALGVAHDLDPPAAASGVPAGQNHVVSASAPPISSTKGSRTKGVEGVDLPAPHFKRPQGKNHKRCCKRCNKSGHNITTCGREAPPPKRPRGRPVGSGTRKRKGSYESDDTQDDLASEMEDDETE